MRRGPMPDDCAFKWGVCSVDGNNRNPLPHVCDLESGHNVRQHLCGDCDDVRSVMPRKLRPASYVDKNTNAGPSRTGYEGRGGGEKNLLQQFRNLQIDRVDLDEAVALLSFGQHLRATYRTYVIEAPAWVEDNIATLVKEVNSRRDEALAAAIKTDEAKLDALRTADEKREDLKSRIARNRAALERKPDGGGAPPAPNPAVA